MMDSIAQENISFGVDTTAYADDISYLQNCNSIKSNNTNTIIIPSINLPENKIPEIPGKYSLLLSLLLFTILAFAKHNSGDAINQIFSAIIKPAAANRFYREQTSTIYSNIILFDVLFVGVLSLFIHFFIGNLYTIKNELMHIGLCVLLISGYIIIKTILYIFIGTASGTLEIVKEFLFNVSIYNRCLGITLFPFVCIMSFPHLNQSIILFLICSSIILAFYIGLAVRTYKILITFNTSIFYLILYLCTLEILPVIYICKFIDL